MASQARASLKGGEAANVAAAAAPAAKKVGDKKVVKMTMVRKDGILKELVEKEEKCKNQWDQKYAFLKSYKQDLDRKLVELNLKEEPEEEIIIDSEGASLITKIPPTSSGMIGWNAEGATRINIAGPLYVSPKSTVIPVGALERKLVQKQKHIVLG